MIALNDTHRWMLKAIAAGEIRYNGDYLLNGKPVEWLVHNALGELVDSALISRVLDADSGVVPVELTDAGKQAAQ